MNPELRLLHSHRSLLVNRAKLESHFISLFGKFGTCAPNGYFQAVAKVRDLDAQIRKEAKHYGDLRFAVMGTYGR